MVFHSIFHEFMKLQSFEWLNCISTWRHTRKWTCKICSLWLTCKRLGFFVKVTFFYDEKGWSFKQKLLLWPQVPFKHNCSWRVNLLYYEHWQVKILSRTFNWLSILRDIITEVCSQRHLAFITLTEYWTLLNISD